jgi:hypothetical protein
VGPRAGTEEHMQEQINRLADAVSALEKKVDKVATIQPLNHIQNRKDIHTLINGQQKYVDALYNGLDKITDKITESMDKKLTPIQEDILDLQLWKSKTTGYVLGISAASAAVFALIEKLVSAVIK